MHAWAFFHDVHYFRPRKPGVSKAWRKWRVTNNRGGEWSARGEHTHGHFILIIRMDLGWIYVVPLTCAVELALFT